MMTKLRLLSLLLVFSLAGIPGALALIPVPDLVIKGTIDRSDFTSPQLDQLTLTKRHLLVLAGYNDLNPDSTMFFLTDSRSSLVLASRDGMTSYTALYTQGSTRGLIASKKERRFVYTADCTMIDGKFQGRLTSKNTLVKEGAGGSLYRAVIHFNTDGTLNSNGTPNAVLSATISYTFRP